MRVRHRHQRAAKLQFVAAFRAVLEALDIGLDHAIGAVKHRHEVKGLWRNRGGSSSRWLGRLSKST